MKELLSIAEAIHGSPAGPAALATLVKVEGSSYRRPGARLLLFEHGRRVGAISGGCLEDDVVLRAGQVLADGVPRMIAYDTTSENDLVWGVGLGCHGVAHILVERLSPSPAWAAALRENLRRRVPTPIAVVWGGSDRLPLGTYLADEIPSSPGMQVFREAVRPPVMLVVLGAGDDAVPLVRLARELGWRVLVADPRPAFATRERFPEADDVVVVRPEDAVPRLPFDRETVAVVMTHHYRHDVPLMRALLPLALPYLGLLGPRLRAERILRISAPRA